MEEILKIVLDLIENEKDYQKLHDSLIEIHPYDIASIFDKLSIQERHEIYEALDSKEIADIFEYIEDEALVLLFLDEMSKRDGAEILNEMEPDDAADILKNEEASKYLEFLDTESKDEITYLIEQSEDTAGSIMTTSFITLNDNMLVKDAMKVLFNEANDAEIIDYLYVVSDEKLIGVLDLKALIIARANENIKDIMDSNFVFGNVSDDIYDVSYKIHNYGLYALPILDRGNLVGVITMDDAIDTIDSEIQDDYEKLAGVSDIDMNRGFMSNTMKRLPWLIILLTLSFLVSMVMSIFDEVINSVTVLVFFQTLILGMAGNSGTQSLAVTVRGISNDEYNTKKETFKNILKEFKIGMLNGLIMSLLAFVSSFIFLTVKGYDNKIIICSIISLSMGLSLLTSGFIGSAIPLLLNKLKIDPAVASGPFITTLVDIISIIIYFSLATIMMGV